MASLPSTAVPSPVMGLAVIFAGTSCVAGDPGVTDDERSANLISFGTHQLSCKAPPDVVWATAKVTDS